MLWHGAGVEVKLQDEKSHLSGSPSHERSWQTFSCRCRTQRSSTCHCWHVMCTASFFPGRPGAGGAIWPWRFVVCSRGPPTRQWNMRNGWEMDDVLLDTGPLPAFFWRNHAMPPLDLRVAWMSQQTGWLFPVGRPWATYNTWLGRPFRLVHWSIKTYRVWVIMYIVYLLYIYIIYVYIYIQRVTMWTPT